MFWLVAAHQAIYPAIYQNDSVNAEVFDQNSIVLYQRACAHFLKAPNCYILIPFVVEPLGKIVFGEVVKHTLYVGSHADQSIGQLLTVIQSGNIGETKAGEVDIIAKSLELKKNRQATEHVESTAYPGNQDTVTTIHLVEIGRFRFKHFTPRVVVWC